MKVYAPLVVATCAIAVLPSVDGRDDHRSLRAMVDNTKFPWNLKKTPTGFTYNMKPVRAVHARVQGDAPVWDETNKMFTSSFGANFETKFRAGLEGINVATRSAEQKCNRKNNMKYVVFYDLVIAQTNETLALYEKEYGPMLPFDGGQCTPSSGTGDSAVFPKECYYFNGDKGEPRVGPFVGAGDKSTDERAPYPNTATRGGLCTYDVMPDGVTCTYNYRILGYIPLDDVVGITTMAISVGSPETFTNFSQFCQAGSVEFNATEKGVWISGIDFWKNPQDTAANKARADRLVTAYQMLVAGGSSPQVDDATTARFTALPNCAAEKAKDLNI
ncbi:hypothetical protein P43SY_009085 [Pythium insidiosum]|uniref:Uncharacterized protein n=1 Tax=Pythium insidiosum TaxID=114742 RepID=A0AAD5LRC9_PYTIN|nr:hypothetical protein P43SY_009085 [Pythium insidiosum]